MKIVGLFTVVGRCWWVQTWTNLTHKLSINCYTRIEDPLYYTLHCSEADCEIQDLRYNDVYYKDKGVNIQYINIAVVVCEE